MSFAVVTFLYGGSRANLYGPEHVRALGRMLDQHLTVPHRFVCITDRQIDGIETYPIWPFPRVRTRPGFPDCWRRLRLYREAPKIADRILMLDLDILIRRNIDHLITDDPFCILKGHASPYGGAMVLFGSDKYQYVYDEFDPIRSPVRLAAMKHPDGRRWIGSDQAWLSLMVPNARTWGPEDGVYRYSRVKGRPLSDDVRVINHGGLPKFWHLGNRAEGKWIYDEYMAYLNG